MKTELRIKHMVCNRCIQKVDEVLTHAGLQVSDVELGRAEVTGADDINWPQLEHQLNEAGFELVEEPGAKRVEQIKSTLITHLEELERGNVKPQRLSELLISRIPWHYEGLSRSFKQQTGLTIERYFILLKIEKVKEMLEYGEVTLAQIADRLGYSSSQHLSGQFKKETGVSVSDYRHLRTPERKRLNEVG